MISESHACSTPTKHLPINRTSRHNAGALETHVSNKGGVGRLLRLLEEIGAEKAVKLLLGRAADAGLKVARRDKPPLIGLEDHTFDEFVATAFPPTVAEQMRRFGRSAAGSPERPWNWQDVKQPAPEDPIS
jgi:hypothetical protein